VDTFVDPFLDGVPAAPTLIASWHLPVEQQTHLALDPGPGALGVALRAAEPAVTAPAVRTLLRHAAAQDEAGDHDEARATLDRANAIAPGAWMFSLMPGGSLTCSLCGHTDPGDAVDYRSEAAAKQRHAEHSKTCVPLPAPDHRACAVCGDCMGPPSPIHGCPLCMCCIADDV